MKTFLQKFNNHTLLSLIFLVSSDIFTPSPEEIWQPEDIWHDTGSQIYVKAQQTFYNA